ncbi:GNAT family N-acetyltransferase [Leucobacter allii]|uniref:GNAT family N-acetyltransferase n=1 Tax=Leucobacter allii TaxID=2932247 RepID=A0ABY4FPE4_9MICO|nr:GNAT family protein [Leucobacter allii]UOQ58150.1 GNAT family N-acetyltransferase [Leucobacter allii]UOR02732.1 GNAT family N-acetyltransferase [Leucobacter allii]
MTAPADTSAPHIRDLDWPRRTARLRLRPAELADADALWRHRGLPEVGYWLSWRPADRADWDEAYAGKHRDLLVVEHEGRLIGDVMVRVVDGWSQREVAERAAGVQASLGWTLDPAAGGRGLATEAVEAVLEACFDGLGLRRVEAGAFAANEPSWRLMERLGMRREATSVQESLHRDLGWIDGVLYALLAEEWRARREGSAR